MRTDGEFVGNMSRDLCFKRNPKIYVHEFSWMMFLGDLFLLRLCWKGSKVRALVKR